MTRKKTETPEKSGKHTTLEALLLRAQNHKMGEDEMKEQVIAIAVAECIHSGDESATPEKLRAISATAMDAEQYAKNTKKSA